MGCGGSKIDGGDPASRARSDAIEQQLKKDRMALRNEVKLLLLGAGESGKSTILKQMRIINEGTYSQQEREAYIEIILSNTIQSMHVLLEGKEQLGIPFGEPKSQHAAALVMRQPPQVEADCLNPQIADAIASLWHDSGVQKAFEHASSLQINDSAAYLFNAIDRIGARGYIPTDQDVLRSRVKTTGITESHFQIGELKYRMFDVGGQRSERKKWIHCFENVTAIIFLVAISEYNQSLYEDETVNRMQESLALFDSICNSRWFTRTSIILFLNKIDLFKEKIAREPIKPFFPDYSGAEGDLQAACDYFSARFVNLNQSTAKQIYVHFTCATSTDQIKFVLSAVNDIIIQVNLRDCGLL